MTDASQPQPTHRTSARSPATAADGPGLDAFTIGVLGLCLHLAATAMVILVVIGLMALYDALSAQVGDPAWAGVLVGLAAVLLIGAKGTLGVAVMRHHRTARAHLADALAARPRLHRAAIRAGFTVAVGLRGLLLGAAAIAPAAAIGVSPGREASAGVSSITVYALLALAYLILAPLVTLRIRRGLRRLRLRRDHALTATRV